MDEKAACGDSEMVLPWTRKPIDFSREFTALLRRKKFKKGTYHTMRHSFASNLARSGVNLKLLAELLGHRSLSSTMIYAHFLPSDLAETMKRLPDPLARLKKKEEKP